MNARPVSDVSDESAAQRAPTARRTGQPPVLALIGCGAFAEVFYLPALARFPEVMSRVILVDQSLERARKLAARFHAADCQTDYQDVVNRVDGVIIAVPHALHYPLSLAFLGAGVPVLCEKPLTLSSAEARDMIARAEQAGVPLATNHTQRLFPSNIKVRELITSGALGEVTAISYAWGAEFTWPTVSGFYFKESDRGRSGALLDRGPHAFDLVCWWLGTKPRIVSSQNDSLGGLDAVSHVQLATERCAVDVRLSWLSKLSNSYTIRGTEAEITNSFEGWWALPVKYRSGKSEIIELSTPEREYNDFARKVVANFIDIVTQGAEPLIPAREVLSSIELVEECYAQATPFDLPWRRVEGVLDGH